MAQTPASEREHERILSSYGGAYDDPKLEALIGKTVDRLVAASDRPDQPYKVTILNSGAVNAFALPNGQLYVTRGLIALASDTSAPSSVLTPTRWRMCSRNTPRSAKTRRARRRSSTRVVTDMSNDPYLTALPPQNPNRRWRASAPPSSRPTASASASPRARISIPDGAARFLSSMERNAALKVGKTPLHLRAQDFLSPHPATPERVAERAGRREAGTLAGRRRPRPRNLSRGDRQHRLWQVPEPRPSRADRHLRISKSSAPPSNARPGRRSTTPHKLGASGCGT